MATAVETTRLVNRNITAASGRTSMRLEPDLWSALEEICHREDVTLAGLIQIIESEKKHEGGRTSAVRVWVLDYYRRAATAGGHAAAGHGEIDKVVS